MGDNGSSCSVDERNRAMMYYRQTPLTDFKQKAHTVSCRRISFQPPIITGPFKSHSVSTNPIKPKALNPGAN
ncbi:hypothetical protein Bca4012_041639 [Brassica carinata]